MQRIYFYLFALVLVTSAPRPGANELLAAEDRPNVLFVAIDDFNDWGPSQLNGKPFDVDTPNFDSLAARGILFRNAHCNAPSCNPSRTSIMSGLHPASTGVYANGHDWLVNKRFDDILLLFLRSQLDHAPRVDSQPWSRSVLLSRVLTCFAVTTYVDE